MVSDRMQEALVRLVLTITWAWDQLGGGLLHCDGASASTSKVPSAADLHIDPLGVSENLRA